MRLDEEHRQHIFLTAPTNQRASDTKDPRSNMKRISLRIEDCRVDKIPHFLDKVFMLV